MKIALGSNSFKKNPVPFQEYRIALKISGMKKQGIT
jgi:hypothetical protein